jgi:hypothetical protein
VFLTRRGRNTESRSCLTNSSTHHCPLCRVPTSYISIAVTCSLRNIHYEMQICKLVFLLVGKYAPGRDVFSHPTRPYLAEEPQYTAFGPIHAALTHLKLGQNIDKILPMIMQLRETSAVKDVFEPRSVETHWP